MLIVIEVHLALGWEEYWGLQFKCDRSTTKLWMKTRVHAMADGGWNPARATSEGDWWCDRRIFTHWSLMGRDHTSHTKVRITSVWIFIGGAPGGALRYGFLHDCTWWCTSRPSFFSRRSDFSPFSGRLWTFCNDLQNFHVIYQTKCCHIFHGN